jgi:hypothetical protein
MKQKTMFVMFGIIIPILFIICLITAVIFSIQKKNEQSTEQNTTAGIEQSVINPEETSELTETLNSNETVTDYEIESEESTVPITGLTDKELGYLGEDKSILDEKMKEFIIGYGYQNATEVKLEESEFNSEEAVFIMTFVLKTHLNKDPYIIVRYQKTAQTFDIQIY